MAQELECAPELAVDDFYLSALFEEEYCDQQAILPVSDSKYAEELQFQEAFMASMVSFQMTYRSDITIPSSPLMVIQVTEDQHKPQLLDHPEPEESMKMSMVKLESGESSQSFCEICAERKEIYEFYKTESCVHSYCLDCIRKYVATKLQDKVITVTCPGLNCKSILEIDFFRPLLPKDVVEIWEEAICEEMIDVSQRFHCPFKDCSAMLVIEIDGEVITCAECPFCHRLFCAQCDVPWHCGMECGEYQSLNADERGREDLMVRELAKEKEWARCPKCKYYVERTEGCRHMTCRCKFEFCYGCNTEWNMSHNFCLGR
ncbi:probable E3 ubiquitin-protein ligase RNF217 [Mangifera indica]|uniref:probable E3 ubiquitin-protein ligase RNF217 n=1 Tax=Mangifera indica TaxID=29780 RepID=UPI001CF979D8|nr:probable E3 ubiquitin-protein ligase RNF217 [Mangifera indica]